MHSKGYYSVNVMTNVAANSIVSTLSIGLNFLIAIVLYRNKTLQTSTNLLLANGALADVLFSISILFGWNTALILSVFNYEVCSLLRPMGAILLITGGTSFLNVFLLTFDRYLSINKPFWYRAHIYDDKRIYLTVLLITWSVMPTLTALTFFLKNLRLIYIISTTTLMFNVVWGSFTHTKIHFIVSKLKRSAPKLNSLDLIQLNYKEKRLSKVTLAMLAALIISYAPLSIIGMLIMFSRDVVDSLFNAIKLWAVTLVVTKSFVNGLLFGFSLSDIRSKILAILLLRKIKSKVSPTTITTC